MGLADKTKNTAEDLKGKAKEAVGDARGDDQQKVDGQADQKKASAKQAGENVKDVFKG